MNQLLIHAIYARPKDYPEGFVCVLWIGENRIKAVGYAETLEGARAYVPAGTINLGRFPGDDPAIAEVWI